MVFFALLKPSDARATKNTVGIAGNFFPNPMGKMVECSHIKLSTSVGWASFKVCLVSHQMICVRCNSMRFLLASRTFSSSSQVILFRHFWWQKKWRVKGDMKEDETVRTCNYNYMFHCQSKIKLLNPSWISAWHRPCKWCTFKHRSAHSLHCGKSIRFKC